MPAFYAGKRVGKPLLNGHTYNAMFNGKLVWPLDKDTVVSIEITDDKGKPLPKSLAVSGTLKLGAKATYADGHAGDLLTTKNVTFTSRDTSTATVSGNTLTWRHGGTILVTATVNGFTSAAASIASAYAPRVHQGHGRFRQTHRQHHPARRREQEPQGDDPARCGIAGVYGQRRQAGYRRGWRRETDRHHRVAGIVDIEGWARQPASTWACCPRTRRRNSPRTSSTRPSQRSLEPARCHKP